MRLEELLNFCQAFLQALLFVTPLSIKHCLSFEEEAINLCVMRFARSVRAPTFRTETIATTFFIGQFTPAMRQ